MIIKDLCKIDAGNIVIFDENHPYLIRFCRIWVQIVKAWKT